jgi:hypothetical protein
MQPFLGKDGWGREVVDNNEYEGDFKDGLPHGRGKKKWGSGDSYGVTIAFRPWGQVPPSAPTPAQGQDRDCLTVAALQPTCARMPAMPCTASPVLHSNSSPRTR